MIKVTILVYFFILGVFSAWSILISQCSDIITIQNNLSGTFYLQQDIDCNNIKLVPMGNLSSPFQGILDGKGFRVKNINLNTTSNCTALFSSGINAIVRNVVFDTFNVISSGSNISLIFASACFVQISNVSLTSPNGTTSCIRSSNGQSKHSLDFFLCQTKVLICFIGANLGGFVGYAQNVTIQNCTVQNTVLAVKYLKLSLN